MRSRNPEDRRRRAPARDTAVTDAVRDLDGDFNVLTKPHRFAWLTPVKDGRRDAAHS
jgi:hypothetical protein